jgi:flagellar hook-associated protein 2
MSSVTSTTSSTSTDYSSSSSSAASSSTTSSTSSSTFSGTSKFADDLQQAITRAVAIASMPITQLNSQKSLLTEQQSAYESLQGKFDDVDTAIQSLTTALGASSYSASNSDPTILTAVLTTGTLSGTYAIDVLTAGTSTQAMSTSGLTTVEDPTLQNIATGTTFTLSVGGTDTTITLTTASLNGLATAINSADAGVQATIVNMGTSDSPDYRLNLESAATDDVAIQLSANGTTLMDTQTQGSQFVYQINGQPAAGISSSSRNITISPGLTATLLAEGTSTLTVGRTTTALSEALTTFVTAYNNAVTELSQYHGQNGGVLEGEPEIRSLESSLRNIVNYSSGSGSATSLFQMGVTFDSGGQLSFNSSALDSFSFSDLQSYFGDGTQTGFLKNAQAMLTSVDDPLSGTLPTALSSIATQIQNTSDQIETNQQRVDTLQTNLTAQMAAADAAIAMLQNQSDYFTNLFAAMKQNSANITDS